MIKIDTCLFMADYFWDYKCRKTRYFNPKKKKGKTKGEISRKPGVFHFLLSQKQSPFHAMFGKFTKVGRMERKTG